jgi:hypothetical protein
MFIRQAKGLKVCKAQGLIQQSCQTFYNNLQLLYNKKITQRITHGIMMKLNSSKQTSKGENVSKRWFTTSL